MPFSNDTISVSEARNSFMYTVQLSACSFLYIFLCNNILKNKLVAKPSDIKTKAVLVQADQMDFQHHLVVRTACSISISSNSQVFLCYVIFFFFLVFYWCRFLSSWCIYNLVLFSCLQLMALVASTLVDLVKNLRAFAGILVVSVNSALSVISGVLRMQSSCCLLSDVGGVLCVCCHWDLAFPRCYCSSRLEVLYIHQ